MASEKFGSAQEDTAVSELIEVPMVKCDANDYQDQSIADAFYQGQYYCPNFSLEDELYQNWYYKESSWLRWAVERCDNATNSIPCKSKEEID